MLVLGKQVMKEYMVKLSLDIKTLSLTHFKKIPLPPKINHGL